MELKLKKVNVGLLKEFLTKLASFNKYVYIKIDSAKLVSRVYLPNKDAVKVVEMDTTDVFEFDGNIKSPIKIVFYNAPYIIKMLDFFAVETVQGVIEYTESSNGASAEKFVVKNSQEKFDLYCVDPKFSFTDMTNEELESTFATKELNDQGNREKYFASFDLRFDMLEKIRKRLTINKDETKFTFKISNGCLYVVTKNNELLVSDEVKVIDDTVTEVTLYKKYLTLLDKEAYKLHLCTNKIIFSSLTSDSKLAIACSIADDEDDEPELNPVIEDDIFEFNDEITEL